MRPCLTCGTPSRDTRCPRCERTNRAKYGAPHPHDRDRWALIVATGTVRCWRCGQHINTLEPWDLGHRDGLPSHPEHANRCNRAAGGRGVA